jgi:hypothetical protein
MANVSRIQGFLPKSHLSGAPWNGQTQLFYVDSADSTAIFVGDAVKFGSPWAGGAGKTVGGYDVEGLASVINVGTGVISTQIAIGVAVGFSVDPTARYQRSRLASTNRLVYVVTDQTVVYEIEEDAVTTPIALGSISLNATFNGNAGNTTTFLSASTLVSSTVANTTTFPLRINGLTKRPNNALNAAGGGSDPGKFDVYFLNAGYLNLTGQN